MEGAPIASLLSDDATFVARWKAAIAREPVSEHVRNTQLMELCFMLERDLHDCRMDLRECNTIMARTVGRLEMQNIHYAR